MDHGQLNFYKIELLFKKNNFPLINFILSSTICPRHLNFKKSINHKKKILKIKKNKIMLAVGFSSVQFSCSVVSDSLWPRESQHTRSPCPSPTPGVHSDSCPSSQWYHSAISSSVVPFSCPQSLLASDSFPMSQGLK